MTCGRTSAEIFEALNTHFLEHVIEWKKIVFIYVQMVPQTWLDFFRNCCKVQNFGHTDLLSIQCSSNHEQLKSEKRLSSTTGGINKRLKKIVNEIRPNFLSYLISKTLCEEMGTQYTHRLHVEVRWLSRVKILTRNFALRVEVKLLFQKQDNL